MQTTHPTLHVAAIIGLKPVGEHYIINNFKSNRRIEFGHYVTNCYIDDEKTNVFLGLLAVYASLLHPINKISQN